MTLLPLVAEIVGPIDFDPQMLHAKYIAERDKRLETGDRTYIRMKDDFAQYV